MTIETTTTVPVEPVADDCGALCAPAAVNTPPDTRPDDCLGTTTRWSLQPCGDHPDAPQEVIEIEVGVIVPAEPDVLEVYPPAAPVPTATVAVPVQAPVLPETGAETVEVTAVIGLFLVSVGLWLKWVAS